MPTVSQITKIMRIWSTNARFFEKKTGWVTRPYPSAPSWRCSFKPILSEIKRQYTFSVFFNQKLKSNTNCLKVQTNRLKSQTNPFKVQTNRFKTQTNQFKAQTNHFKVQTNRSKAQTNFLWEFTISRFAVLPCRQKLKSINQKLTSVFGRICRFFFALKAK